MPTVSVGRDLLFEALGKSYTEEEFDELCFEFGIELDDVTTEKAIIRKEKHLADEADEDEEVIYKIDVPANRYDLLCLEGLARALRVFLGTEPTPSFKLADVPRSQLQTLTVKPETALIRPFVVAAILRGMTFNSARYQSFIDLQERLHQNLCRRRTLVAIGTHDLDTLQGPFTYEALPPQDIRFVPLKQTREFAAPELMEFYKSDVKLKKFLGIIEDSPVFPVVLDSNRTVLSLPPIINGAHSAIKLQTKNVFIECTATDLTKANIVLNTMVTMFSEYCKEPFVVEPVQVIQADGTKQLYPDISSRDVVSSLEYINNCVGVTLDASKVVDLLNKMQLNARHATREDGQTDIAVAVPPQRSDILHACDVMEDVAIAYGYNNLKKTVPKCVTVGRQQPLNHFADLVREEVALAGFSEVLTWILLSAEENGVFVNGHPDRVSKTAVVSNPRSSDFQVCRSSLLPGVLKTLGHNKDAPLPIKLFECGDVVLLDSSTDVGSRNERKLVAVHCSQSSGFEVIHGLVNRIMEVLDVPILQAESATEHGYSIQPSQDATFFPKRQANILYKQQIVGTFGVISPEVLERFDIPNPCSAVELSIQPFL
eukprot:jgi/Chlat1/3443/Chrsp23S03764